MSDEALMREALALAAQARPSPNPRVGCVLVRDGAVVGRGFHRAAGMAHAEVEAIRDAGDRARGATAYVTLEPCNHHGRTPPCTDALVNAGVTRVVFGVSDPNPHVEGRGADRLRAAGVRVDEGVEREACEALIESWRVCVTRGTPLVVLKVAMTIDGRIATRTRASKWITGPEARRDGHVLRARADAVLVGVGTVLTDDPMLTPREVAVVGSLPARVVLDSRLRTPTTSVLARTANEAPVWVLHGPEAPDERRGALRAMGVETIEVPLEDERIGLRAALRALAAKGVTELLVEGGGAVHGSLLDAGLGDKLVAYVAPKIFGGRDAFPAFAGTGASSVDEARQLRSWRFEQLGQDLKITAEIGNVHGDHHSDR
ncbi:MAG: bifunctional diaminohydroxyphosphoribosylaminopyrimidine deaminase/5-amino-6-(5-phosphoribosylamino)uracil reductase RibD [Myxococcales bacterium]|nr:bifunctional diaminohydroxyphosphoribosylaminopyrimidine deaminase/5-amino-6-(5-phosphoribosylamino)uracil reductase RibD [Myxococcales bacterium]